MKFLIIVAVFFGFKIEIKIKEKFQILRLKYLQRKRYINGRKW